MFVQEWVRKGQRDTGQPRNFHYQQEIHQERALRLQRQPQEDPRRRSNRQERQQEFQDWDSSSEYNQEEEFYAPRGRCDRKI